MNHPETIVRRRIGRWAWAVAVLLSSAWVATWSAVLAAAAWDDDPSALTTPTALIIVVTVIVAGLPATVLVTAIVRFRAGSVPGWAAWLALAMVVGLVACSLGAVARVPNRWRWASHRDEMTADARRFLADHPIDSPSTGPTTVGNLHAFDAGVGECDLGNEGHAGVWYQLSEHQSTVPNGLIWYCPEIPLDHASRAANHDLGGSWYYLSWWN